MNEGFIKTNLYVKPDKHCTYLLNSSCHPKHICENIPYSLALRLKRICSEHIDFLKNLDILKNALMTLGYKCNYIMTSFDRDVNIDRTIALQKVKKKIIKRCFLPLQP